MKLFWQYPVITEKKFFESNHHNDNFIGIPWATIIDKKLNVNVNLKKENSYTCCQHIYFRKLIPTFKQIGIDTLYTPHKIIGENTIDGITIIACPLYAVNFEDPDRNQVFRNKNFESIQRKYLFSFVGGYQDIYLTDIRKKIFKLDGEDIYIKNTGDWHFNSAVYSNLQNENYQVVTKTDETNSYNEILLNSRYSLCPSGSGPNSIRFWESLAIGSIPVLLSDTLDLPFHDLWNDSIIRIKESEINNIREILNIIPKETEIQMRKNCIKIYNEIKL